MEFDELVEHLADLTELARDEGFVAFADQLHNFRVAVNRNRGAFDVRVQPPIGSPARNADKREFMFNALRAGRSPSIDD